MIRTACRAIAADTAWQRRLAGICVVAVLVLAPIAGAMAERGTEYQIKAAFLFKFGSYVEWPESAFTDQAAPFSIGVTGAPELIRHLEEITTGKVVAGRPVQVRTVGAGESLGGIQMLFVGADAGADLPGVLVGAGEQPVLIVTETDSSLTRGSMINFVVTDNKVRFDVGLQSAERNHLKISSRLLAVARRVVSESS